MVLIAVNGNEYNLLIEDSCNYIRRMFDSCNDWERQEWVNKAIERGLPAEFINQLKKDINY